jgi:hypothetical protein
MRLSTTRETGVVGKYAPVSSHYTAFTQRLAAELISSASDR